jgi:hypothetical protein
MTGGVYGTSTSNGSEDGIQYRVRRSVGPVPVAAAVPRKGG